jgi:hypothetical protein
MSCCVALVRTDVSEALSASIIRVTRIGELGTLAVTSNRCTLWRNTNTSVLTRATRCNVPEDTIPFTPFCHKIHLYNLYKNSTILNKITNLYLGDLVVRVPGYRSRGLGFNSRRHQIFWEVVGLERGPLSLVRITGEVLGWKVVAPVYPQESVLTSPVAAVSIVRLWTKSHWVCLFLWNLFKHLFKRVIPIPGRGRL